MILIACTQTFYFSFRSFRARVSIFFFPHHYPLALAVNKSSAVYILSRALDGLWRENRRSVNRLQYRMSIFFITTELFRQRVTCRTDRTIHEVYISFQIYRKVFLGLSVSTIYAQKKTSFPLNSSNDTLIVFPVQKSSPCMAGGSLRRMQQYTVGYIGTQWNENKY